MSLGASYLKMEDVFEEEDTIISSRERKYRISLSDYITNTTKELKQALYERKKSVADDFHPEQVIGLSEMLDFNDVINIERQLGRKTGPWYLSFSTSLDGRTLENLYHKMEDIEGPVLISIKDVNKNVFGAFLSDGIHSSDDYYGSPESFLFTLQPTFKLFPSTRNSKYFIRGNLDSLCIGGDESGSDSDGKHGLLINDPMKEGLTESTSTFGNPPLIPENNGKFTIKTMECWYFSFVC